VKSSAKTLLTLVLTLGSINTAAAYVGPGAGLNLLGALWGLLAAVIATLSFVLIYPFRRLLAGRRRARTTPAGSLGRPGEAAETPAQQPTRSQSGQQHYAPRG
jgi:hypothetical protein